MSEEPKHYVNIGGTLIDLEEVTPPDRAFREAWVLDEQNSIVLDPVKTAQIRARALAKQCSDLINARATTIQRERINAVSTRIMKQNFGGTIPSGDQAKLDMADDLFQWILDMEDACKTAISSGDDPVWPTFDPGWAAFVNDPVS